MKYNSFIYVTGMQLVRIFNYVSKTNNSEVFKLSEST